MKPEEFTQWLSGYLDACGEILTTVQLEIIKLKLQTVFNKVTPNSYQIDYNPYLVDNGNKPSGYVDSFIWSGNPPNQYQFDPQLFNYITC